MNLKDLSWKNVKKENKQLQQLMKAESQTNRKDNMSKITYKQVVEFLAKDHINHFKKNRTDAKTLIEISIEDDRTGSNEVCNQLMDNSYIEFDVCEEVIRQVKYILNKKG